MIFPGKEGLSQREGRRGGGLGRSKTGRTEEGDSVHTVTSCRGRNIETPVGVEDLVSVGREKGFSPTIRNPSLNENHLRVKNHPVEGGTCGTGSHPCLPHTGNETLSKGQNEKVAFPCSVNFSIRDSVPIPSRVFILVIFNVNFGSD